jgi:hypothetical protein
MNLRYLTIDTQRLRSLFYGLSSTLLVLSLGAGYAVAQSTNRNSPTPLSSNTLAGRGQAQTDQTYFYSFTAGPGELTLTLDVDAGSANGNGVIASVSVQDTDGGVITSLDSYATPGMPGRQVERVSFPTATPVILILNLPHGATSGYTYNLQLSGALNLTLAQPGAVPAQQ